MNCRKLICPEVVALALMLSLIASCSESPEPTPAAAQHPAEPSASAAPSEDAGTRHVVYVAPEETGPMRLGRAFVNGRNPGLIMVVQTPEVQECIAALLAEMRSAGQKSATGAQEAGQDVLASAEGLNAHVRIRAQKTDVLEFAQMLQDRTSFTYVVVSPPATKFDISMDAGLRDVLDRVTALSGMPWQRSGSTIIIGDPAGSYLRFYPVQDLLISGGSSSEGGGPSAPGEGQRDEDLTIRAQNLILLIKQACGRGTWEDEGMTGLIDVNSDHMGGVPVISKVPIVTDLFRERPYNYPDKKLWWEVATARMGYSAPGESNGPRLVFGQSQELWVIAQAEETGERSEQDDSPGSGALMAKLPDRDEEVPVPLKHTSVDAQVSGYISAVRVVQQFHNPYDQKIEAVYVFPLPQDAAVNEFVMTVGDRRIRGIIREREEAERIYHEARSQGHVASLMTQERPNIFTQKVANIEPGKAIDVDVVYFNTLAYRDGWYEFVFPMVVGPRYNPPGSNDGVGAVARGAQGMSGQKTEVQYLRPGERSGHDIDLTLEIDAGVAIEEIDSRNHAIREHSDGPGRTTVTLSELDRIPNKDFVLRYKVAGRRTKSALLTHRDERGGHFALMLFPPDGISHLERAPMEIVFVLDCSGSMSGKPIEQAKKAIERGLTSLREGDTFQLIRFSNDSSQFGPRPVEATRENVRRALKYLRDLSGYGGTEMIEGIKAALDFPHDERRVRVVAFLTDGFIGNEAQILGEVYKRLGATRVFSFGVGSSPNRYLLDRMAKLGRGAVAYVGLNDDGAKAMGLFFDRISHPAMTDISIDWGRMEVSEVYANHAPELFVGRPLVLTGRFEGEGSAAVKVSGKVSGKPHEMALTVDLDDAATTHKGIPFVWARTKIADMSDRATYDSEEDWPGRIRTLALDYGLMSAYTAFVAVDSLTVTEGDHGVTVHVPVPVPDGVRYDTTVQDPAMGG